MFESNYYIGDRVYPFHLSVGAVVYDDEKRIAINHFKNVLNSPQSFYLLMRETLCPDESLEQGVARGLKEELGIIGKIEGYLGCIVSSFPNWEGVVVEKTTLYFLVKKQFQDPNLRVIKEISQYFGKEPIADWLPISDLINLSREQGITLSRSDFDESGIITRARAVLDRKK